MIEYKQDMPPPGGYAAINYKRIPLKLTNIWLKVGAFFGITTIGWIFFKRHKRILTNEAIEYRCAMLAILPLLTAENDRAVLLTLKKNREYEEKLMENVPEWEVGKWKHYPMFLTLKPDEYFKPNPDEYFAHADRKYVNFLNKLHLYT